ncbi:MAG: 4Fe-4S binding protein [Victivallales bacterium]|nr:4Fe-4S binding protein [Victivallales bacterium]
MKRKIITIDESKCDGCGLCIPDCPEGALQIIDGKARLVSDLFCDGLGACIGTCPKGAISTEEREAEAYDERRVVRENIIPKGKNTIKAHLKHLVDHKETELLKQALDVLRGDGIDADELMKTEPMSAPKAGCGCSGTMAQTIEHENDGCGCAGPVPSRLSQWPVEMHLISPDAGYFADSDLLVAADCTAFSYGNFHDEFIKGRSVVIFCPKLDGSNDAYVEKMTALFSRNNIKSVTIARMEVPCCGGTEMVVREAMKRAGKNIPVNVKVISISGTIK